MYIVICNQHKCKTLYPHENIKHNGPCLYCWEKLRTELLYSEKLFNIVKGTSTNEETEEIAYTRSEDFSF